MEQDADTSMKDNASDITAAFGEFMEAFEAFKETNDERLATLEAGRTSDTLVEEKLQRIEKTMDRQQELMLKAQRPALSGNDTAALESKAAMDLYIRKGKTEPYDALQRKGMSVGSEADGGYLVPDATETALLKALQAESPMRRICSVIAISTAAYKRPFAISGAAAGWVAETGLRPGTDAPKLAELAFPAMELYASPAATKQLLDDSVIDIEAWLLEETNAAFGAQESRAFISGDGVAMPRGILDYPRAAAKDAVHGQMGTVQGGLGGEFDAAAPADAFMEVVHSVNARNRANGAFVMNRTTLSAVRRLKNADGDYLMQPRLTDTLENRLLGFPVEECEDMPDMAADAAAIAFGDFKRGYLIVDRQGVQILRDPFSVKPYVLFYATKRVGGGVQDFNAIRLMVF